MYSKQGVVEILLSLFALLLIFPLPALAGKTSGFDIVTMKNGDIHQGTVAVESLSVNTGFGKISVPYHRLLRLKRGVGKQSDLLTTRQGEHFRGRVVESEITMLRVLDVTLPLLVDDVLSVIFASREIQQTARHTPDAVTSNFGDRFLARVINRSLLIKTSSSIALIERDKIRFIDTVLADDDGDEQRPTVQITLTDGSIRQGDLMLEAFQLEVDDGRIFDIAVEAVSTISFNVGNSNGRVEYSHRWEKPPASLFQDVMADGVLAPEMVIIQGQEFVRGDAQGDSDERPPTAVSPGAFVIGVFEITFEQYDQFCTDTRRELPDDGGWGRGSNPVVNVSWLDARAYTDWLSNKTRKRYRLPSDAEWEYAARAGTESRYWWGDETGVARANCEGCNSLWDGAQSAPVGKFAANPLGLHDTAGNVFEWVADCYHDSFANAPADGAPLEKPGCGKRVIRGGAWSFPPKEIRSANRWRDFPTRRSDDTGFRVARDVD